MENVRRLVAEVLANGNMTVEEQVTTLRRMGELLMDTAMDLEMGGEGLLDE